MTLVVLILVAFLAGTVFASFDISATLGNSDFENISSQSRQYDNNSSNDNNIHVLPILPHRYVAERARRERRQRRGLTTIEVESQGHNDHKDDDDDSATSSRYVHTTTTIRRREEAQQVGALYHGVRTRIETNHLFACLIMIDFLNVWYLLFYCLLRDSRNISTVRIMSICGVELLPKDKQ
jgi:lipopolysaccharide export LptBFGC system permease protein LptF